MQAEIYALIRGTHFRGSAAIELLANLPEGLELHLVPEPANPYDHNAIQVHCIHTPEGLLLNRSVVMEAILKGSSELFESTHLGYIGKEWAAEVMPYFQRAAPGIPTYTCTITYPGLANVEIKIQDVQ